MSAVEPHTKKFKKRKQELAENEPVSKRSKTESTGSSTKTDKMHKSSKSDKAKKHKGKTRVQAESDFIVVSSSVALSIPPVFANNLHAGAEEMLDDMVMRYIPVLQGVVLAHHNLQFLDSKATIKADCPFSNCHVRFDATVWSPRIGMKLVGKVNLCSPDHISLLIHRTFNVSIPRQHIPTDNWEFEYGPAENDPEYGASAEAGENGKNVVSAEAETEDTGRWVHKITGEKLGGRDAYLEFTVIGLTIANRMLSLVGSIQPDPFAPEHVPDHSVVAATSTTRRRSAEAEVAAPDVVTADADVEASDDEEEEDTFGILGRMGDAAAAAAREEREREERGERKRKRKEKEGRSEKGGGKEKEGESKKKKKKTG